MPHFFLYRALIFATLGFCFIGFTTPLLAHKAKPFPAHNLVDLMHAYQDAKQNDPTFRAAQARYRAAYAVKNQALGALLPNLSAFAEVSETKQINPPTGGGGPGVSGNSGFGQTYSLSVTQPLINVNRWFSFNSAQKRLLQAKIQYAAAKQELMLRTAAAYFTVLQSYDNLKFTRAEKKSQRAPIRPS